MIVQCGVVSMQQLGWYWTGNRKEHDPGKNEMM